MLCGWTFDNSSDEATRNARTVSAEALGLHFPPGSRALTPCATIMDPVTRELRCAHKHAGKHLRTSPGASVTLLPSGLAHIVEPCGGHSEKHTAADTDCDGGDPYVLWYVMAAPAATGAPGTGGLPCNAAAPYGQTPYPAGAPNPNNPDPTGAQSILTRHWPAGATVPYIINGAGAALGADIFAASPLIPSPGSAVPTVYTWATFISDIDALMSSVNTLNTANAPQAVRTYYPSLPSSLPDPAFIYTPQPGGIMAASGQLIWATGCSGPTGNGLNEFIFQPVGSLGAGAIGGVASMLLNVTTGEISECDVIFEATNFLWTGIDVQTNSGLAHEVGHFWGLDHTNLHPGGMLAAPNPPFNVGFAPTAAGGYPNFDAVPAMTGGFTRSPTRNRVLIPWLSDDIAAFSLLYPVNTIAPGKLPLINTTATIIGSVMSQAFMGQGSFGENVLAVLHDPTLPTLTFPTAWPLGIGSAVSAVVGTVSGTYRSELGSVTGRTDTSTGAPSTGEFRLDGIPTGGPAAYALVIESLGSRGLAGANGTTMSFTEWWYEPLLNATNNRLPIPLVPAAYTGYYDNTLNPSTIIPGAMVSNFGVSSMLMAAGTIIRLDNMIDPALTTPTAPPIPVQSELVSRPLVQVAPRNFAPLGSTMTITICHNRVAGGAPAPAGSASPWPLQSLVCTWIGKQQRTTYVTTTTSTSPSGGTMYVSTYTVIIPASMPMPATVTVLALEAPGSAGSLVRSVVGENQVVY